MRHLILGGRRSGKSAYGESLALNSGRKLTYVATSRAYDEDHAARIEDLRARMQPIQAQTSASWDPTFGKISVDFGNTKPSRRTDKMYR